MQNTIYNHAGIIMEFKLSTTEKPRQEYLNKFNDKTSFLFTKFNVKDLIWFEINAVYKVSMLSFVSQLGYPSSCNVDCKGHK